VERAERIPHSARPPGGRPRAPRSPHTRVCDGSRVQKTRQLIVFHGRISGALLWSSELITLQLKGNQDQTSIKSTKDPDCFLATLENTPHHRQLKGLKEKEYHLRPPEERCRPWWRCCEKKKTEWDCPAAGEQTRPTGCPSPPSGIPQRRRHVERIQHPQSPKAGACPGAGAGSPHPRKMTPPGQPSRPPAAATTPWPNDKIKFNRSEKGV
jgi:hypothetical protein